jgi:hypothetical protein
MALEWIISRKNLRCQWNSQLIELDMDNHFLSTPMDTLLTIGNSKTTQSLRLWNTRMIQSTQRLELQSLAI